MKVEKKYKSFGGETQFWVHDSKCTKTKMKFSVFIPDTNKTSKSAIIWLSGLTCNEENFITKSGIQSLLTDSDTMIICPDTSPRNLDLPNEHDSYDFGSGAGFYVNATTKGYKDHYRMYDYVNKEIHEILTNEFKINSDKISIMGHSMGGHGALILGLKNPQRYQSVSAFSPIVNPVQCAWGKKAFNGYLGDDEETWEKYDACKLLKQNHKYPQEILIDQGLSDEFLEEQLLSQNFVQSCETHNQNLTLNMREGYDHSYYFIMSFLKDHVDFHLQFLK